MSGDLEAWNIIVKLDCEEYLPEERDETYIYINRIKG